MNICPFFPLDVGFPKRVVSSDVTSAKFSGFTYTVVEREFGFICHIEDPKISSLLNPLKEYLSSKLVLKEVHAWQIAPTVVFSSSVVQAIVLTQQDAQEAQEDSPRSLINTSVCISFHVDSTKFDVKIHK